MREPEMRLRLRASGLVAGASGHVPSRDRGLATALGLVLGLVTCLGLPLLAPPAALAAEASKYARELQNLIKGQRAFALKDYIVEVAGLDDPKLVGFIPPAAVAIPSRTNHLTAVQGIAGLANEECVKALVKLLKRSRCDFRENVVILDGFGRRSDAASLDAIIEQFSAKIPLVQVAAIRAARERKAREVIAPLGKVLDANWKSRDRAFLEARDALAALTGQDFDVPEDWKKYLATLPENFDPKKVGEATGPTVVVIRKTADSVEFFGTELFSRNIVFVIDVSGSMVMYDDSPDYKGDDPERDRERLRRAREQLIQALKKLPRAARFNVIAFSDKVLRWKPQMQVAAPASVAGAIAFVNEFKARGATHTDEAMEAAFEDPAVDTIVLLSDGAPTKQGVGDSGSLIQKILEKVRDLNSARRVRIETFGFDGPGAVPGRLGGGLPPAAAAGVQSVFVQFLEALAEESGGSYRPIE